MGIEILNDLWMFLKYVVVILITLLITYKITCLICYRKFGYGDWKSYKILHKWIKNIQDGKSIEEWFDKKGYKTIAIYGMGEIGSLFYDEIKKTDIEVKYFIDKNSLKLRETEIPSVNYREVPYMDKVDVIITTASAFSYEMAANISSLNCDIDVFSVEDVMFDR